MAKQITNGNSRPFALFILEIKSLPSCFDFVSCEIFESHPSCCFTLILANECTHKYNHRRQEK